MWSLLFKYLSIKKPRLHTMATGVTRSSPTWILLWSIFGSCCCVPRIINSNLSSSSFNRLVHIQSVISLMQFSRFCILSCLVWRLGILGCHLHTGGKLCGVSCSFAKWYSIQDKQNWVKDTPLWHAKGQGHRVRCGSKVSAKATYFNLLHSVS